MSCVHYAELVFHKLCLLQAVPLYLSEIAPAHARGSLNVMFQMATTIGIWVAQWINYGTQNMHPHGWRLSVGLAIVPALILFLGSLIIPDTPNSLVKRGQIERAREPLERVRGTPEVEAEFAAIVEANDNSKNVNKWAIFQRKYRPVLVRPSASCFACFKSCVRCSLPCIFLPRDAIATQQVTCLVLLCDKRVCFSYMLPLPICMLACHCHIMTVKGLHS